MNNYTQLKQNNNVGVYWKETEYTKDGQVHKLTQLVMRVKVKDELDPTSYNTREIVLSNKDNYKQLYFVKVNNLA